MTLSLTAVTTTADVRDRVLEASGRRTPLRVIGRGNWLNAGRPVRAHDELCVAGLTGIVEYNPGDLTLTARAGTPLDEIARTTEPERQWLALHPFGPPSGSLGATVATASAGPLAHAFGTPRDNVLGMETVTGSGAVVRSGGRVVKNVAGFDLTRLFTGSWGTLGIITEVTVRLRSLPETEETYALPVSETLAELNATLERLRSAPIAPLAVELVNARLASRLGVIGRTALLLRVAGNQALVRAQRDALAELGELVMLRAGVWDELRECEPEQAATVRLSALPTRVAETWDALRRATESIAGVLLHSSVCRGIVRGVLPYTTDEELTPALEALACFPGARIFERLPARQWDRAGPSSVSDRLSRSVKRSFDPLNLLNPGILGEVS